VTTAAEVSAWLDKRTGTAAREATRAETPEITRAAVR
jgi:hypothetical protein